MDYIVLSYYYLFLESSSPKIHQRITQTKAETFGSDYGTFSRQDYSALTHSSNIIKNEISSSDITGVASHGKHTRATEHVIKLGNKNFSHVRWLRVCLPWLCYPKEWWFMSITMSWIKAPQSSHFQGAFLILAFGIAGGSVLCISEILSKYFPIWFNILIERSAYLKRHLMDLIHQLTVR